MRPDEVQGVGDGAGDGWGVAVGGSVAVGMITGVGGGLGIVGKMGTVAATARVGSVVGAVQAARLSRKSNPSLSSACTLSLDRRSIG